MTLTTTHIITLLGVIGTLGFGYYLAKRKGDLKKLGLYFSPSRMKRRSKSPIFFVRGKYIPSIGVLNFFKLPKSNHKRICFHIFLTIENTSKYALEDVTIVLTYPRKLFDENDKNFFDLTGRGSKRETEYMFFDDEIMQVTYNYPSIHPKGMHQIIHPLIISTKDCFKEISLDDPLFFDIKTKDFCFDQIGYKISAKNLPAPVMGILGS